MRAPTLMLLAGFAFSTPALCAENPPAAGERTPRDADRPAGADATAPSAPTGGKPPAAPVIRKSRIRPAFPPSTKRM
ncbi:MAG TPA: hypothetical protein VF523_05580 [Burkholderiales bacterium]